MIEEEGKVVSLSGDLAEVRTERRGGCTGCGAQAGCGTGLMDRFLGRRSVTLRARNQAGAAVGDRVVVGVSEAGLLGVAFAAYFVPLVGLVLGGALGQWLGRPDPLAPGTDGGSDLPALMGALLGFLLALFWLRRYSAHRARLPDFDPVVLRRLSGEAPCQPVSPSGR